MSSITPRTRTIMDERLQKLLAAAGVASRRASEDLIRAGRVTVNGEVVRELGARANPERDEIAVDGVPVHAPAVHTYFAINKPPGYTSTVSDPHAAHPVTELLHPGTPRVFPVGRLDRDSEGLLLLTDDGELTARLLHPRYHVPKEYAVLVHGRITEDVLRRLRAGVQVTSGVTAPAEVEMGAPPRIARATGQERVTKPSRRGERDERNPEAASVWLWFTLYEGRKRQIREMCEAVGLEVGRLVRTRMGPITLGGLRPGQVRPLSPDEVIQLYRAAHLKAPAPPGRRPARRPAGLPPRAAARGGRPAAAPRGPVSSPPAGPRFAGATAPPAAEPPGAPGLGPEGRPRPRRGASPRSPSRPPRAPAGRRPFAAGQGADSAARRAGPRTDRSGSRGAPGSGGAKQSGGPSPRPRPPSGTRGNRAKRR